MYVMQLYIQYCEGIKKQLIENFKSDSEAVLIKITGGGLGKPNYALGSGHPLHGHESS
jgi:hypothetical protein